MNDLVDVVLSLAAISFLISWLLVIAWIDFGRPRHSLTWAIAFGLFGVAWLLVLMSLHGAQSAGRDFVLLAVSAAGTALASLAFRQRGGDFAAWRPIAIATLAAVITIAVLLWWSGSFARAILPYDLLNAAACWYASAALVGRRQGERAAERLALLWLRGLGILFSILFLLGLVLAIRGLGNVPLFRLVSLAPVLPAVLTGVGLFAIFLLTADLADQSRRLAGTDMLTGLLNRRGFDDAALAMLGSAQRADRHLCLAVIDIDRFKDVNDRFGHLAGDDVLRRFATCLAGHVGPRDILARVGGEEFALMLADRDCENARVLLESARAAIADCALDLPTDYRITASFGLATLGAAYDLSGLFSEADRALYQAKTSGRNRVVVAD